MGLKSKVATSALVIAMALPVVKESEGLALIGYYDPIDIPTECYGHTKDAVVGRVSTEDRCERLLKGDLLIANQAVRAALKIEVDPHIEAAMTSFTYNAGSGNFRSSTMLKELNAGNFKAGCAWLSKWVYAGGRKFLGLERRRAKERALCEQAFNPKVVEISSLSDDSKTTLGRRRSGGAIYDLEMAA